MKILLIFPRIEHGAFTYHDKESWTSILFGYPIITHLLHDDCSAGL